MSSSTSPRTSTSSFFSCLLMRRLPICTLFPYTTLFRSSNDSRQHHRRWLDVSPRPALRRSEEHTSELQSPCNLVVRLLLEKKSKKYQNLEASHLRGSCLLHNLTSTRKYTA